ncbi:MAG: hypothetical protein ACM3TR_10915 [Caulobacteraceae bacterium]
MDIIKEKVIELMERYCEGNYNAFARELGLNVAHLYRTLNNPNSKAGAKFLGSLIDFCERKELDYKEYIFLNKPLTACNDTTIQAS